MLRDCDGAGNAGVGAGVSVFSVSAGCDYMGGTRGAGVVSNADDVLQVYAVRGVRGAGGVCEICICLVRDGVGGVG